LIIRVYENSAACRILGCVQTTVVDNERRIRGCNCHDSKSNCTTFQVPSRGLLGCDAI